MTLTLHDAAVRIANLTDFSRKTSDEVALSLIEEKGELAAELKIYLKIPGTEHKKLGKDGIYGECADVWICAVSQHWADYRFLDWSPGSHEPITYLSPYISRFLSAKSMNELEWAVMAIAFFFEGDKNVFCQKIHEKLDKWERNVGYLKMPAKPTGTCEALKNCTDIARAIQMKDNS